MKRMTVLAMVSLVALVGCDRVRELTSGTNEEEAAFSEGTPEQFIGTWAADCQRPYVRFAEHEIQVFADGQTYPINSVFYDGQSLRVDYSTGNGRMEETFAAQGENLTLVGGIYDGVEMPAADAMPMQRCE
ncbi:hypothetical protein [Brevundimonas aveniformis]|uniref:hypothetical protein n=1 Tax=Brevundimonas aveniformis TaxID=370977 RepID=UPI0024921CF9|nr:hypothetical protein [Brevundimonas aveniformis]